MATGNLRSVQGLQYDQQNLGEQHNLPRPQPPAPIAAPVAPLPHHSRGSLPGNESRSSGTRSGTPLSVPPPTAPIQVNIMQKNRPERRRHSSNSGGVRPKLSQLTASSSLSGRRALSPNAIASAPGKPLNTHSPVALAAAAAVTPEKIGRLLQAQGPLAIRHITAHLAQTIPGFGDLSLSKQRRLIIAVLDNGDTKKGITFDKVGWGRWAVREAAPGSLGRADPSSTNAEPVKSESSPGPWSTRSASLSNREGSRETLLARLLADSDRRTSISNQLPNHRLPLSPRLMAAASNEQAIEEDDIELAGEDLYKQGNDEAVFSDDDDDDDSDRAVERHDTDEEDWQRIGPAGLRMASPREQEAIQALVQLRSI